MLGLGFKDYVGGLKDQGPFSAVSLSWGSSRLGSGVRKARSSGVEGQ